MRVGIHQINYLPWMGYFNKMAKSDIFVLLDEVQLTDSGMMQRNRVLNKNGSAAYLTIPFEKKGYLEKKFSEIQINNTIRWQTRQKNFLFETYHKFPYWEEVFAAFEPLFNENFIFLEDINMKSISILRNLLDICTPIVLQSQLEYNRATCKDAMVLEICKAVGADIYLSGNGARNYMNVEKFIEQKIQVQYQVFHSPVYSQRYAQSHVNGLSMLDVFLNCGINETKRLFWENIQSEEV